MVNESEHTLRPREDSPCETEAAVQDMGERQRCFLCRCMAFHTLPGVEYAPKDHVSLFVRNLVSLYSSPFAKERCVCKSTYRCVGRRTAQKANANNVILMDTGSFLDSKEC